MRVIILVFAATVLVYGQVGYQKIKEGFYYLYLSCTFITQSNTF
jgi:hypothetical protein